MKKRWMVVTLLSSLLCQVSMSFAGGGGSGYKPTAVAAGARCFGRNVRLQFKEQRHLVTYQVEGVIAGQALSEVSAVYWNEDTFQVTAEALGRDGKFTTTPRWKIEEYGAWWYRNSHPELLGFYKASLFNPATGRYVTVDDRVRCTGLNGS